MGQGSKLKDSGSLMDSPREEFGLTRQAFLLLDLGHYKYIEYSEDFGDCGMIGFAGLILRFPPEKP